MTVGGHPLSEASARGETPAPRKLNMSEIASRGLSKPIIFRVVSAPAGWRILGADAIPMATVYLSRRLAVEHANEMAEVLQGHGQQAEVIVEGEGPSAV